MKLVSGAALLLFGALLILWTLIGWSNERIIATFSLSFSQSLDALTGRSAIAEAYPSAPALPIGEQRLEEARAAYIRGDITIIDLERQIEQALRKRGNAR